MAKRDEGTKQFMLDYNAKVVYPYTLLDCIIDGDINDDFNEGDAVTSGIDAILKKLMGDKRKDLSSFKDLDSCVISLLGAVQDGSTYSYVSLDKLKKYDNSKFTFLGSDGYFKTVTTNMTKDASILFNDSNKKPIFLDASLYITKGNDNEQTLNLYSYVALNLDKTYFDVSEGPIKVIHADSVANLDSSSVGDVSTAIYYNAKTKRFDTCTKLSCDANNINFTGINPYDFKGGNLQTDIKDGFIPLYFNDMKDENNKPINTTYKYLIDSNSNKGFYSLFFNGNIDTSIIKAPSNLDDKDKNTYVIAYDASTKTPVFWKEYSADLKLDYTLYSGDTPCYLIGSTTNNADRINSAACATTQGGNTGIYFKGTKLYQTSDERLKTFTSPIDINFDNLLEIKKGEFYWNDDPDKTPDLGVSAQSLEAIYPQIVDEVEGTKTVSYNRLGVIALAAIDKLHLRIKALEKEIKELKKELNK